MSKCLDGARVFLCPEGLGKKRRDLFAAQIARLGGRVAPHPRGATHLVLEGAAEPPPGADGLHVSTNWLSECIKRGERVSEEGFLLRKRAAAEDDDGEAVPEAKVSRPSDSGGSVRNQKITSIENTSEQCNQLLLDELQKLAEAYKNSGDKWRNFAYTKAISAIKCYGKAICSYEEALALPGLGEKMATKVWELLETGQLQRTKEVCNTEEARALSLFNGVWGVGPTTAQNWYTQGLRTLDDLREKASLTRQQLIGLKYYEEIQTKIPRSQVEEITAIVKKNAILLEPEVWLETCGSYRRGKESCGDIDIVLSLEDGLKGKTLLQRLVQKLKDEGCITDDLSGSSDQAHKFLGICLSPSSSLHRRLDLFVVPWGERGCALLHYTGSAHFNRSLRRLALKRNWTLSDHALTGDCGNVIPTNSERDIFEALGVEFRPPDQREHALDVL